MIEDELRDSLIFWTAVMVTGVVLSLGAVVLLERQQASGQHPGYHCDPTSAYSVSECVVVPSPDRHIEEAPKP